MNEMQEIKMFDKIISDLKEKYKGYPLFQITDGLNGDTSSFTLSKHR